MNAKWEKVAAYRKRRESTRSGHRSQPPRTRPPEVTPVPVSPETGEEPDAAQRREPRDEA